MPTDIYQHRRKLISTQNPAVLNINKEPADATMRYGTISFADSTIIPTGIKTVLIHTNKKVIVLTLHVFKYFDNSYDLYI